MKRLYTVEQANQALPYVRVVVKDAREHYRRIKDQGKRHNAVPRRRAEERAELRREIQEQAALLRACQEELHVIGVKLEDYELGQVDFPAELDDRPILLCWEDGEEAVAHWHEVDGGYLTRKSIPGGANVSPAARE